MLSAQLLGCAVSSVARGTAGTDLSPVHVGATRAGIERHLGKPARQWTTSTGVHYCLYTYDRGLPGSASDAAAVGFLDLISLGLVELFWKLDPPADSKPDHPSRRSNVAVAYDTSGVVLGVFVDVSEMASLPEDGRAAPASPGR